MTNVFDKTNNFLIPTFKKFENINMVNGNGIYLFDENNNKYLDFMSGVGVCCLGYKNKQYIKAGIKQLKKIIYCQSNFCTLEKANLAELLVNLSNMSRVFFCNSGTESIEAAIKIVRKFGIENKGKNCVEIITMKNSFHGRTIGSLSITSQGKYKESYGQLLSNIKEAEFNNLDSVRNIITENTAAIILEPIQGKGGIVPAEKEFLKNIRDLCDKNDIALIFDEIQCGIGRTGNLFAYQYYNIVPDIICIAKGLGNGFPIGALLVNKKYSNTFTIGSHSSTFGGNPFGTSLGYITINTIITKGILHNIRITGDYLKECLLKLKEKYYNLIDDIRGVGLIQCIELNKNISPSYIVLTSV